MRKGGIRKIQNIPYRTSRTIEQQSTPRICFLSTQHGFPPHLISTQFRPLVHFKISNFICNLSSDLALSSYFCIIDIGRAELQSHGCRHHYSLQNVNFQRFVCITPQLTGYFTDPLLGLRRLKGMF